MYEGLMARESADEIREFFVGPYFIVTAKHDGIGQNLISVLNKPWSIREEDADVIGDLGDVAHCSLPCMIMKSRIQR